MVDIKAVIKYRTHRAAQKEGGSNWVGFPRAHHRGGRTKVQKLKFCSDFLSEKGATFHLRPGRSIGAVRPCVHTLQFTMLHIVPYTILPLCISLLFLNSFFFLISGLPPNTVHSAYPPEFSKTEITRTERIK